MKAYREWLPANGYEATGSLGGSFYSDDIADYYLTPYDLGYGPFVKFDHDFIGREALEKIDGAEPRRKVTLAWNGEDVAQAMGSLFEKGDRGQVHRPAAVELLDVAERQGPARRQHGRRLDVLRLQLQRALDALARRSSTPTSSIGTEVTLVWGEEGGGSSKPVVERHTQVEIRAVVSPCPYSEVARTTYAEGWRTEATV